MSDYTWDQTFELVTIEIVLKAETMPKEIKVEFFTNRLKVTVQDIVRLEGELWASIAPRESTWFLDGNTLYIELVKVVTRDFEGVWSKCFKTENKFYADTHSVDHLQRKFHDLSDEWQAKVLLSHEEAVNSLNT